MDPLLLSQVDCDPRMHALGVVLKRWGKARRVLDAARGTLSTYALHLMLVFFLQNCQPQPVLPCLQPTRGIAGSGECAGCSVRRDATAGGGRGWSTRGRARIAREELGSVGGDAEVARLTLPRQAVEGAHRLLHGANGGENTPRRAWAVNVLSIGGNRRMKTKMPI